MVTRMLQRHYHWSPCGPKLTALGLASRALIVLPMAVIPHGNTISDDGTGARVVWMVLRSSDAAHGCVAVGDGSA
eukprot:COSAG02_NODE_209_length_28965_cov_18.680143_16_plen_75_part_00